MALPYHCSQPHTAPRPRPRPRLQPHEPAPPPAARVPQQSRPVRVHPAVYRRRRLAVLAAALVTGAVVVLALSTARASADGAAVAVRPPAVYAVKPGDSLWSIAAELAPDRDPRAVVAALERSAGTEDIQPGQHILLPPSLQR